jgi:hypothetical protein
VSRWSDLFDSLSSPARDTVDSVDTVSDAARTVSHSVHSVTGGTKKEIASQSSTPVIHFSDWRALFEERVAAGQSVGHARAEAEALAWGELQTRWHAEHGERVSADLCAGCRRPLGEAEVLSLIDSNRVHFGADNACLVQYGTQWRRAATQALRALGLTPPVH